MNKIFYERYGGMVFYSCASDIIILQFFIGTLAQRKIYSIVRQLSQIGPGLHAPLEVVFAMRSWPLLLPTFGLSLSLWVSEWICHSASTKSNYDFFASLQFYQFCSVHLKMVSPSPCPYSLLPVFSFNYTLPGGKHAGGKFLRIRFQCTK